MNDENKYKIYLSPPHQSGKELGYLEKVLESNWLAPGGHFVKLFENRLKSITQRNHCIALNSGTAGIHLALKVLGIERGDHVICQTFSFVASANPISYLGAIPVFVDSERDTWNIDPELMERAILDMKRNSINPKAIIYTHIYGNPANALEILDIARKYEIPVIEDAAEALGAKLGDRSAGCFGDFSIFSFNGNKVITTSGGGALLTDNENWAQEARSLATQARDKDAPFAHDQVGFNYQMSNISAALGLAQIPKLDSWIEKKRAIFKGYVTFLQDIGDFEFVQERPDDGSSRWLSVFLAPDVISRKRVISTLNSNNIECRRFWKPLHLLGIYPAQKAYVSDVSVNLFERGFCLPSGVGLLEGEQGEIKAIIKRLY